MLRLVRPWEVFWSAGLVSSVLDNAPTYLVFLALLQGQHLGGGIIGVPEPLLAALSLGTVFMGAGTYIGNGPNFMVRAIAERRGIAMPSFLGYLGVSAAVLGPIFLLVTWIVLS